MSVLEETLVLLAGAVALVAVFRRLTLPPVLGYLAAGIVIGPSALGLVGDSGDVRLLAEFGVVFLLFTIGLEFSFSQLVAMRWTVLGLGGAQVLTCGAVFAGAAWLAGADAGAAVVTGGALALSSTAIVTKQLTEQVEIHTGHGRRAVGILLLQDLAVVPLLIVIPLFADDGGGDAMAQGLVLALAKGLAVFAVMVWIGRRALRPLFSEVARARSNELFTLAVLLIALLAAWTTHLAGLSLALGAFIAGVMLGETEYRHQIEADIRPFRDVLLGLFFITVGMLVDPLLIAANWHWVLAILAGLVLFKLASIYVIVRLGGDDSRVALRTAVVLAQGGEFGFAVLSPALSSAVIDPYSSQLVLAAIVLSMLSAPLLIRHSDAAARWLRRPDASPGGRDAEQRVREEAAGLDNHVVVCGFGRTGQNVVRFLETEGIRYLALDLDPARVRQARAAGDRVTYGDTARREILNAAALQKARLVVVTFTDPTPTLALLGHTRELASATPVVVRTRDDVWMERFEAAGATVIVPEVLEASLMLASQALALLDLPVSRILRYVREVRANRYRMLRGYFHGHEGTDLERADRFRPRLRAVDIPEGAGGVGESLAELDLAALDVEVEAIRRGGVRGLQPEPELRLAVGDVLVLYGTPENLERAGNRLMNGAA